jgi:hypothetical protein
MVPGPHSPGASVIGMAISPESQLALDEVMGRGTQSRSRR